MTDLDTAKRTFETFSGQFARTKKKFMRGCPGRIWGNGTKRNFEMTKSPKEKRKEAKKNNPRTVSGFTALREAKEKILVRKKGKKEMKNVLNTKMSQLL